MGLLTGNITVRPTEADEEERNQEHIKTNHLLPNLNRPQSLAGCYDVRSDG